MNDSARPRSNFALLFSNLLRHVFAGALVLTVSATAARAQSTVSFEAESLTYTPSGATASVQTDANSSGGKWVELASNGTGQYISFAIPSVAAGTYQVQMEWKSNGSRGILQLSLDGTNLGPTLDQYSASSTYPTTTFGSVTFSTTGTHTVRLTVTGKNSKSSSYQLSADKYTFVVQSLPEAATPTFSPVAGTYTSAQSVTIITGTSGASIRYTTDGSTPTETNGTLYSAPVTVGSSETLKAIAYKTGYTDSSVASSAYTINLPPAAAPTFSPVAGTYSSAQTIAISSSTTGASIRYTTDGSTPGETSGTLYGSPVAVNSSVTLKAIAYANGFSDSAVSTAAYTINLPQVAAPVFSPMAGTYSSGQIVTITSGTNGASIRYTTDGSTPSETAGTLYSSPVNLAASATLKAIAYEAGFTDSTVSSAAYTITLPQTGAPTFSPAAGTYTSAQSVTITSATSGASIRYTTDGSTPSETAGTIYSVPVTISSTATLKSIAYKSGMTDSAVTSGTYTITSGPITLEAESMSLTGSNSITPTVNTDTNASGGKYVLFAATAANQTLTLTTPSIAAGLYQVQFRYRKASSYGQHNVKISGTQVGGTIDQYASSTSYTTATLGSITFSSTGTHSIVLTVTGKNSSSSKYNISADSFIVSSQVAAPTFSPAAGTYTSVQIVAISTTTGGGSIRYTTDGSTPSNTAGTLYSGPITIGATVTLKAIAYQTGMVNSAVTSGTYTINLPKVATPAFSPAAGTYTSVQTIAISTTTGGATIRYTTDGSTPSETAGTIYTSPVGLTKTTTLKAIAYEAGMLDSSVASGTFTLNLPVVSTPSFSPGGGTYTIVNNVTITTSTTGATIRYTKDGSTPSETNGTIYSGPVLIDFTLTLKAIAYESGMTDSSVKSSTYTTNLPQADAPFFTPPAQTYANAQNVAILSPNGASIGYTTDGSTPTANSGTLTHGTQYSTPVPISAQTTLMAIAFKSGLSASPVTNGVYTFGAAAVAPVFTPGPGTYASGQTVTMSSATSGATIRYTTDGSTPTESNGTIYSSPVSVGGTAMLKAIAYKPGSFADSPVEGGLYTITSSPAMAVVNVLYDFTPANGGGDGPEAALIQGSDGNFYGTASDGGSGGYGTVFKITPSGAFTALASFDNTNGAVPVAALVQGSDGNFYGTTEGLASYTTGTAFKMTPAGVLTTLVSFDGPNGANPEAALIQGSDGNYYGTTVYGGLYTNGGTLFKISPAGVFTTMDNDAACPAAALVQGSDGNYYGTTKYGGNSNAGSVFTRTQSGAITTLFSFSDDANGGYPVAALVQGTDGNFYGTTEFGGGSANLGTIFRITPGGTLTTLVAFTGSNGGSPHTALLRGTDGNFYGTAGSIVFKMTPAGVLTTLISLDSADGGAANGLIQGTDGNFYGTTGGGGAAGGGVVFQLITPMPPFAPVFSLASGSYASAQSVTISSNDSNAIHYTTDGSTPTAASYLYTGPVSITSHTILHAIGVNANGNSFVTSATYDILPLAAAPVFSPGSGTYANEQSVTITSASSGASIRYTTDGSAPTENNGTFYLRPVLIVSTTPLKAIAYGPGVFVDSSVTSATYTINPPQAAPPNFSPASGVFNGTQTVTITSASTGATIVYTTDGSTPTETNGTIYLGPVSVTTTTAFQAIAYESGFFSDSGIASATYVINPPLPAAAPVFSPASGTYSGNQTIRITSASPGVSIRYTTDGSTPTEAVGALYLGPVSLGASATLQAVAYGAGLSDSNVMSASYTINMPQQVAAPTFSLAAGTYSSPQSVTISTSTVGASIRFTTDGSTPSETAGTIYSGPVNITSTMTLRAIAFEMGFGDSSVGSAAYTISFPPAGAPLFSPMPDGQSVAITSATPGITIRYTVDGSVPTETTGLIYSGPVRITTATTLQAMAYGNGFTDSPVSSVNIEIPTASITTVPGN